ncbi:ricin-type beta-trefoil lectin domain protein [Actinoallomurus sp. CA-150999]|uniref:ricin-type beta-trefoil lectin domain protein n=1 Tax=Actinoallomurus sp. CA-150999 TaxID=3239887 RepID=UPI003D8DE21E
MNLKQVTFALAAAGTTLVGAASAASAAPASDVHAQTASYQYKSVASGKCLDTKTNAGNQAVRRVACHGRGHKDIKHQLWILDNNKTLHSLISPGNCLALRNSQFVISKKCSYSDKTQQWQWVRLAKNKMSLKNVKTKKCLALNHDPYLLVVKCNKNAKGDLWTRSS